MRILASDLGPIITLLIIIAAFAVIAVVAYVLHRVLRPKMKNEDKKPSDEEMTKENLDRLLQPVDDDQVAKQISEYKDEQE